MKYFFEVVIASLILVGTLLISGDDLYDPKSEVCCNGTVHEAKFFSDYYCCDTELVYRGTTTCCNGKKVSRINLSRKEYECCVEWTNKIDYFTPKLYACCNGNVYRKPNSYQKYHCCGSVLYDVYAQICCNGVIYEFQFNVECCGTQLMKTKGNNNNECCGDIIIDNTQKVCCKTRQLRLQFDYIAGDPQIPTYDVEIYDRTSSKNKCCGLKLYDYDKEICCIQTTGQEPYLLQLPDTMSNDRSAICCGNNVILNRTNEICCGNTVHDRSSIDVECCNKEVLYDYKTQICCGKNVYEKENQDGPRLTCCKNAGKLYNSKKKVCCGEKIIPKPEGSSKKTACCAKH